MEDAELDPVHARMRTAGPAPWDAQGRQIMGDVMDVCQYARSCTLSTGTSPLHPAAIPAAAPSGSHPRSGLSLLTGAVTLSTWLPNEASGMGLLL